MTQQIDYEINKELGECYLFMGDFDKAHDYYQKAIACDNAQADPFLGLAAIAINNSSLNEALVLYTKANSISSNDKSLAGMGMVQMELGQHDEAFSNFTTALEQNPNNMVALNGIVQLAYFLQRLEEILPFLEKALEHKEDEAVRYTLAGCLLALGEDAASRAQLEILLGHNPGNEAAQQLYAQFVA